MERARIGKHGAVFPAGYQAPPAFRSVLVLATRSRRVRAFFWALPPSRLRTYFIAAYYHRLTGQTDRGDFGFVGAVREDADLTMFGLGTHRGEEGWKRALDEWRETLGVGLEMSEFVNPGGSDHSMIEIRLTGRGASSGISVNDLNYLVVRIENGEAVNGRFFREKADALEAVGLRTRRCRR